MRKVKCELRNFEGRNSWPEQMVSKSITNWVKRTQNGEKQNKMKHMKR